MASVSIEAIADRAGVSARTFFNYFDSKEDAALLELFHLSDDELATFSQGPAADSWPDLASLFADDLELALHDADFLRFLELQDSNPGLAGRQLAVFARFEARASAALRQRLSPSSEAAVRAPPMVGCCFTAVRVALDGWALSDRRGPVRPYLEHAPAILEPAFGST